MQYCTSSATTSCAGCCMNDVTKCKYIPNRNCGATGHYYDAAKDATPATAATMNSVCCTARHACYATTATSVCLAGYKQKMQYCETSATTAASCDTVNTNCCENDLTKCQHIQPTCATGFYIDPTKYGTSATQADKNTVCCTAKATCVAGNCAANERKREFNYCGTS